jgi:hypothetical protein
MRDIPWAWANCSAPAGGLNGIAEVLNAGHAASPHAATVHEKRIKLDAPV